MWYSENVYYAIILVMSTQPEVLGRQVPDHVLTVDDLSKEYLVQLFCDADEMKERARQIDLPGSDPNAFEWSLNGKSAALVFLQPSTRTHGSFVSAVQGLGCAAHSFQFTERNKFLSGKEFASAFRDQVNMTAVYRDSTEKSWQYYEIFGTPMPPDQWSKEVHGGREENSQSFDTVILRSSDPDDMHRLVNMGATRVINAGNGSSEHPTQTLLDLYTLYTKYPEYFSVHSPPETPMEVVIVGDLKHARTVHSLVQGLRKFPNIHITCISKKEYELPEEYAEYADTTHCILDDDVLRSAHAVYTVRDQKEYHAQSGGQNPFTFDRDRISLIGQDTDTGMGYLLHPLPRTGEIPNDVVYPICSQPEQLICFEQVENGVYAREALLRSMFSNQ